MEFLAAIFNPKIVQVIIGLHPNRLSVIIKYIALSYLKTNYSRYSLTYFQNKAFSSYVLLVISGMCQRIFSVRGCCNTFHYHAHTFFRIRTLIGLVMLSLQQLKNACIWTHGSLVMTLDGFSALLFVRPALEK